VPVVPEPAAVARIAARRAALRLAAAARDGQPVDGEAILRQVRDEVLRELSPRPRLFERPRALVLVEGGYGLVDGSWELRLHAAIGLLGVAIGPTAAVQLGELDGAAIGLELGFLAVPGPRPRAAVLGLFLRFERGVSGEAADTVALGARYLLDLL
jgi:hypothetical protein